jgi:choline dehydrogenase-like flavoprotein
VLEAGRPITPEKDYAEHVPMWEMKYRGMGNRKLLSQQQPIQQQCYACDEMASKFFVNDVENPYTTPPDKPFSWIRGRQVGGRSIVWGRQVYRWSDLDFEANAKEAIGVDWPIRYADIAPWYDHVERFVGKWQTEGLPQPRRSVPAAHAVARVESCGQAAESGVMSGCSRSAGLRFSPGTTTGARPVTTAALRAGCITHSY